MCGKPRQNCRKPGADGQHSARGQRLHEFAPSCNQTHCIFESKNTCQRRRNIFADAMTDECLWPQTKCHPIAGQRIFDAKQRRLRGRSRRQSGTVAGEYFFLQVKIDPAVQRQQTGVKRCGEHRFARVKRRTHGRVLCALAREHEYHIRCFRPNSAGSFFCGVRVAQGRCCLWCRRSDDADPLCERLAACAKCVSDVGQVDTRIGIQMKRQPFGRDCQRRSCACRHH